MLFLLIILQVYQKLSLGNINFLHFLYMLCLLLIWPPFLIFFLFYFLRLFIQFIFKLYSQIFPAFICHWYFCHWIFKNVSQFCILISVIFSPTDSNNCLRFLTFSYLICKNLIYGPVISVSVSTWHQGLRGVSHNISIMFSWENIHLSTFSYFPDIAGAPNWTSWIWQESMQHTLTICLYDVI